jgi:rod shape-determining protein MreD
MKQWMYVGLIVALVPLQTTIWRYTSIAGVSPDLCLVVTCLVGILSSEMEGVLLGLALGFLQDLFSPGEAWLNILTKGTIGLLAGMAGRHLAKTTPTAVLVLVLAMSATSGLAFLFVRWPGLSAADLFLALTSILLPEAFFNAALAAALFWLLTRGRTTDDRFTQDALRFGA